MKKYLILLAFTVLSNCGAILASIELAERVDEAERLEALIATSEDSALVGLSDEAIERRRLDGLAGIAAGNPNAGSVRYTGQAAMVVPQGNGDLILSARAQINANFANSTISADFNDWLGYREGDNLGNTAGGDVVFSNGVIGGPDGAGQISGDVAGELTFKGDTFIVDGVIDGQFALLDGQEGVGGVTLSDQTTITQDGVAVQGAEFGFAGLR